MPDACSAKRENEDQTASSIIHEFIIAVLIIPEAYNPKFLQKAIQNVMCWMAPSQSMVLFT